jgi:non-heme chloroperoxidase
MPFITVDKENSADVQLYYEDHGTGQPVVMIHGFPLSGDAWEKQQTALAMGNYRAITYDRRGFGRSDKPAVGYDYDTFAADLNRIMTKLNLRDVVLVGHSMGTGEVTRYLAKYGSDRVNRAVFISPLMPFLLKTEDNPAGVDMEVFDGIKNEILADRYAYLTSFLNNFYNTDETLGKRVSKEVLQGNWNTAAQASARGTHDCVSAWLTDFREDIKKIDVPSLIIQGDADRILPLEATGKLFNAALEGSRLVVLKDAPHGIPWSHGEEINREMMAFMMEGAEEEAEEIESSTMANPELAFREQLEIDEELEED